MKTSLSLLSAVAALAWAATPAWAQSVTPSPQTTIDARWTPWLGCWRLADETINDPANFAEALAALQRSRANAGSLVCVTPGAGGATLTTLVNDQPILTETIVPDGAQHTVAEPGCRGWQRAEWSQLGARLYAHAEISCADQTPRRVSGLGMMTAGPNWIDIQLIEGEGRKSLRVRRYQRADDQKRAGASPSTTRDTAAMPLGSRFSLADVKEASGKVAPEVLQAALVELKSGFNLNGKTLVDLSKAGVPEGVIDLMVALTFPKRFVVDRAGSSGGGYGYGGEYGGGGGAWGMTCII